MRSANHSPIVKAKFFDYQVFMYLLYVPSNQDLQKAQEKVQREVCVDVCPKPSISSPMLSQISPLFIFSSLCAIDDPLLSSLVHDDIVNIYYVIMLETRTQ